MKEKLKGFSFLVISLVVFAVMAVFGLQMLGFHTLTNIENKIGIGGHVSQTQTITRANTKLKASNVQLAQANKKLDNQIASLQKQIKTDNTTISSLQKSVKQGQISVATQASQAAQEASVLSNVDAKQAVLILQKMSVQQAGEILAQMSAKTSASIMSAMPPDLASQVLAESAKYAPNNSTSNSTGN